MERLASSPRPNWQAIVASQGLHYHSAGGEPYWDERACYRFDAEEIHHVEEATDALHGMCLQAVERVIGEGLFGLFGVPPAPAAYITRSWEAGEPSIYGRLDLSFDGFGPPKLLEYNADTPTTLLEAAVIQRSWLIDTRPDAHQFNSIHERLLEAWSLLQGSITGPVYFASSGDAMEDYVTVSYLRDTAMQAQLETAYIKMEQIGWRPRLGTFVDLHDNPMGMVFKLYPWDWMLWEEFGTHLHAARPRWLEPPWKLLLNNKAILAVLYEMFPGNPYLLRAGFEPTGQSYVRKPLRGREGANVSLVLGGRSVQETGGPYAGGPWVFQEAKILPDFGGHYPVIGSWVVNGHSCGIGIREDYSPVTGNASRFVPHFFEAP